MTTPTQPNNLGTNPELAVVLKQQLDRRMGEAQALVEASGWPQPQVKQVVSQLLYEMQQAAPPGDRSYLSLEEALDTNEAG